MLVESGKRLSEPLEAEVSDPERACAAVDNLTVYRARQEVFVGDAEARVNRIEALSRDDNAPRESLEVWTSQLDEQRRAFGEDLIAAVVGLKDVLEPQEWDSVAALMLEEEARWKALLD